MLRPRIIPFLMLHKEGLFKTCAFDKPKYIGDPLNAVRIFNEKEVDELIIVDIDASRLKQEPNYNLLTKLAAECRMPLCYGGGVKTVEHFERIINLGIEKVAVSSAIIENPELIFQASKRVGSQSVVAVIDVKKTGPLGNYEVVTLNASKHNGLEPSIWAKNLERLGVGEIVINSVDRDGSMSGYDFDLIDLVRHIISIPLTVVGGAGSLEDIRNLVNRYGIIGAGVGSLFVFKGKYRAVLINYPSRDEKLKCW